MEYKPAEEMLILWPTFTVGEFLIDYDEHIWRIDHIAGRVLSVTRADGERRLFHPEVCPTLYPISSKEAWRLSKRYFKAV